MTTPSDRDAEAAARLGRGHEVTVVDGRFTTASCTCGWRSAARRSRLVVRAEARDHVLLYADGSALAASPEPRTETDRAEA